MDNKLCGRRLKLGDAEQIEELGEVLWGKVRCQTSATSKCECLTCDGTGQVDERVFKCPFCKAFAWPANRQFAVENSQVYCRSCDKEIKIKS